MINTEYKKELSLEELLEAFSTDQDLEELKVAIEALKSITDRFGEHVIAESLKGRVKALQAFVDTPPKEMKKEEVLGKVLLKAEELAKKAFNLKQKRVVPDFTKDTKSDLQIYNALIKLRKHEFEQLAKEEKALELYTPLEGRSDFNSEEKFKVFDQVMEFLNDKKERCLLLMGDAGSGKTTFSYFLEACLWQEHEKEIVKDKPIPILIPLMRVKMGEKELIEKQLKKRGLDSEEIKLLKEYLSFVFILEGYDDRNIFDELYKNNRLSEWNCQVITTCRSQALLNREDNYRIYFAPDLKEGPLREIILCPFTAIEIQKYVGFYTKLHSKELEWDSKRYWEALKQLPSVLALVSNPLILNMTIQLLPAIVKKQEWKIVFSDKSDKKEEITIDEKDIKIDEIDLKEEIKEETTIYDKMSLTQAELYDKIIEAWFDRQIERLNRKGKEAPTMEELFKFNQDIAMTMLRKGVRCLEDKEIIKSEKDKSVESTTVTETTKTLSLMSTTTIKTSTDNWQFTFLDTNNEKTLLLLSGWLLKKEGPKTYAFLHDSLRSHFAAKQICHGALSRGSFALGHPLNDKLIVDEPDVINPLIERLQKQPVLEEILVDLINTSKHEPLAAIAAANAITILVRAGISLSGRDLSRVRISGADLSGAFLDGVDFTEADLRNVRLNDCSLHHVNFTGACMDGVQFGQYPLISLENEVRSCTYSPDGKWLAIGDDQGYIHLYDARKGSLVIKLENWSLGQLQANPINSLCFSRDSQILAVGSGDGLCRIWDVNSMKKLNTLKGHNKPIYSVCFGMDDQILASGSSDKTIRLWDISSDKEPQVLKGHTECVHSISFSSDGKTLASGSSDKTIRLWDVFSGEERRIFEGHTNKVTCVCFGMDDKILASGSFDKTVRLWDVFSGEKMEVFQGHTDKVISVSFRPDKKIFASGSIDGTVRLWDISFTKEIQVLKGHTQGVLDISFSTDGKILASGGFDKTVRLWDTSSIKSLPNIEGFTQSVKSIDQLINIKGHTHGVNSISVSFDGKTVASCSEGGTVRLWDISSGKKAQVVKWYTRCVSFSLDGKILVGGFGNTIRLWDITSQRETKAIEGHIQEVISVRFSPDEKILASGSSDKTIRLWDISSDKEPKVLKGHTGCVFSISFSADGKILASGSFDKTVRLWDVSSGKEIQILKKHTDKVTSVSFSPYGRILASGSLDKTVRLWDVSSGKEIQILKKHTDMVTGVSFSPDGKILASGSYDETVRLWDVSSGECFHVLDGFRGGFSCMTWDSTGECLITGDESGAIQRFHIPKDLKNNPPLLLCSSHGTQGLYCKNTTITYVTGLSSNNRALLEQNDSTGQVSEKDSKAVLLARDGNDVETVGESCNTIFGRLPNGGFLSLTAEQWVVSLAYKKEENEHAFLILEGIENKKRAIYRAEVFIDEKRKDVRFTVPVYGELGFGYAYVEIRPITVHQAEELAKQCSFRSECITKKQAEQLKDLVIKYGEKTDLRYNVLGDNKIYQPFYAINLKGVKYGNCLTFAEKWLNEIGVKFVTETSLMDSLKPFDITSDRSYLKDHVDSTSRYLLQ
jgi:WD40 repeat protein